jgi:hypothetical protein
MLGLTRARGVMLTRAALPGRWGSVLFESVLFIYCMAGLAIVCDGPPRRAPPARPSAAGHTPHALGICPGAGAPQRFDDGLLSPVS